MLTRFHQWLETRASRPAYGGVVLLLIAISFFGAATNTMVGWLYALSGLIFALLGVAAVLPPRALKSIKVRRAPIYPVSAGDQLTLELILENPTRQPKTLLQVIDRLPKGLGNSSESAIEMIPANDSYHWVYRTFAAQRGIYHWSQVELRTATPLGLFWSCRRHKVNAKAIVYPFVLSLRQCWLLDTLGEQDSDQFPEDKRFQAATVGLTRGLRPYRRGDSPRLIHWRSSARYGELRVRELEQSVAGQDVVIGLNSAIDWEEAVFEDAVTAAASLYFYARRSHLNVKLWTARSGLIQSQPEVLGILASVQFSETKQQAPPSLPLVWLTCDARDIHTLPWGSRWLLFAPEEGQSLSSRNVSGLIVDASASLQQQLQKMPERH